MAIRFCPGCGVSLRSGARFCSECGRPAPRGRQVVARDAAERRRAERSTAAVAVAFGGVLVALVLGRFVAVAAGSELLGLAASTLLMLAAAAGACGMLAPGSLRASFASAPERGSDLLLGVPVGLGCLAVAVGYTELLRAGFGGEAEVGEVPVVLAAGAVLVAPFVEEWLFRGALWHVMAELAHPRAALLTTSLLFALAHGLNGGFVLECPHRFLGGLALGWLRLRSGSLLPGIVAHFVWNAAAIGLAEA
ncbi:MAG: CPBP family intramembrane metalloprotease [Planctomycetes bacterium]|nr:CPBP family intramembrane metalloprotease [Planctomycetota bacterium]